jgi:tripartite ATP-independent transporter DctP family solute receptor
MQMLRTIARGFAALTMATLLTAGAAQAADLTLRFSTAGPPADFLAKSMESFKADIEKAGVGIKVEVYPSSKLFRQGTEVPAIQRGNLEMSTMNTFEISQQIPAFGFLNRAYLFKDYDHMMMVMQGPVGNALHDAVAKTMGIEILSTAYLGTRQVNLRKARPVKTPDDLKGVKMRMPASPEWLLLGRTLDVEPTPMGMAEVYVALQTGTVDGQENPLTIMYAAKFFEVTQQVVLTSHLVQPVFFALAKPVWDKMTDAQKKVVKDAAIKAADQNNKGRYANEKQVADLLKTKGLKIETPDLAAFRANADKIYAASDLAKKWDAKLMAQAMKP